jgi:hypothetical protein
MSIVSETWDAASNQLCHLRAFDSANMGASMVRDQSLTRGAP